MTRISPYDFVFGGVEEQFDAIRAGAAEVGRNPSLLSDFLHIPETQRLLGMVESPDLVQQSPDMAAEYLLLLWAAYRFREAGCHTFPVSRKDLEPALDTHPPPDPPRIPYGACYVQLPERWFWAQPGDGSHEPVDGMFLVASPSEDELVILAVLGLRPDRPGFSQLSLTVAMNDLVKAGRDARTPRFAPVMEGGGRAGFRSLVSQADLLLLVQLALASATA